MKSFARQPRSNGYFIRSCSDARATFRRVEAPDPWGRGRSSRGPGAGEDEEMAAFRRFQQFLRQQDASPGRRPTRRRTNQSDEEDDGDQRGRSSGPPPGWDGNTSFEDYLIKAQLWLATTKTKPRARGPLLLKSLTGIAFESPKHYAKDVQWLQNDKNAELLLEDMNRPER